MAISACNNSAKSDTDSVGEAGDSASAKEAVIECFDDLNAEQLKETWKKMAEGEGPSHFAIKDIDGDGVGELALKGGKDNTKILIISKDMSEIFCGNLQSLSYSGNIIFSSVVSTSDTTSTIYSKIEKSEAKEYFKKSSIWNAKSCDTKEIYTDMITGKEYSKDKAEALQDKILPDSRYLYFDWQPVAAWNNPDAADEKMALDNCWKKKVRVTFCDVDAQINDKGEVVLSIPDWNAFNSHSGIMPKYNYAEPFKQLKLKGLADKAVGLYAFCETLYIYEKNKNIVCYNVEKLYMSPNPYVSKVLCEHGLSMEEEQQEETVLYITDENDNIIYTSDGHVLSVCSKSEVDGKYRCLHVLSNGDFTYVEGDSPSDLDVIYVGDNTYNSDKSTYHIHACKKKGGDWEKVSIDGTYTFKQAAYSTEEQMEEITPLSGLNLLQSKGEKLGEPREAMYSYHFKNK